MKKEERTTKVKRSRCCCYCLYMTILSSSSSRFAFRGFCANAFTGNTGRVGVRSSLMSSLGITDHDAIGNNDSSKHNKEIKPPTLILPSHPDFPISSVMAPMVAASDYPFRLFLREHCGVQLTYTQMLLSKRFVIDPTFRKAHLDLYETQDMTPENFVIQPDILLPSQIECLGDDIHHYQQRQRQYKRQNSEPLMVQLAGDDVKTVVQSALMTYEHTDGKLAGIDLNCGCPQNIAKKGNYGAFLMERDPKKVNEILTALRNNLPSSVAISAKIRLPADDEALKERIPRLIDTGINFLTVHGRTIVENKTKVVGCHIDRIRLAVQTAHKHNPNFPVIANGGMENYDDVQSVLQSTGASAAMSSEALLETPDLFLKESMDIKTPEEQFHRQLSFAKNYLDICSTVGPPLPGVLGFNKGGSFSVVRGHLFKFLHRYINTDHQDLRDRLAANGVNTMRTLGDLRSLVEELESRYANLTEDQWNELTSTSPLSSWYRRHRKPDRSVHERYTSVASDTSNNNNNIDDRKREIKDRIAKMKAQKLKRTNEIIPNDKLQEKEAHSITA
jgi:tRNA-dihydrouridine synthase